MSKVSISIVVLGFILGIFMNYPPPEMSDRLKAWKKTGKYLGPKHSRVFYQVEKTDHTDKPVLLCVHGFPTMSYDWYKIWEPLKTRFSTIIAADFLGFGFSDKPVQHNYTISGQADVLEGLLRHLEVTNVHLLSHDYGDTVAQELLYRFEKRKADQLDIPVVIESICLLNGGVFPETHHATGLQKALTLPVIGDFISRLSNRFMFKKGFGEVFGPRTKPSEQDYSDLWIGMVYNNGYKVARGLLQYIAERRANRDRWVGVLQKSSVPVHMIYGPADPVNPPAFVDHYKKTVKNPSISVLDKDIGHYPQLEDPENVIKEYFEFLKKLNIS